MEESDIDLSIADDALIIRGEKKIDRETEENGFVLRERRFGLIERTVPLPDGIDPDAADATFRNGVLTVVIPKTAEAKSSVKRVTVKGAESGSNAA
jgi:HSP20 family protein